MWDFFMKTRWRRDHVLERLGLTPNDAKALHTLSSGEALPMGALAAAWGTDASAATWVVDRLERKGLAERRAAARDRRVKLVALTPAGRTAREEILRAFYEPPPELLQMNARDLRALREILGRLAAAAHEGSPTREG